MEEWDTSSRNMLSTGLRATCRSELKINEKIAYREGNTGGKELWEERMTREGYC